MAIQEIVSAIDEYIARLRKARDVIASLCNQPEASDRKPMKRKSRRKPKSIGVLVPPPSAVEVAVQIIPARAPRQGRRLAKPPSPMFSALGGPIPKGPVVIPPSDLARMRSLSNQVHPAVQDLQRSTSGGALEELAQEVAKRLASGGGFPH
jgi:hypothetical protein